MSAENLNNLFAKIQADPSLKAAFQKASTADQVASIAAAQGYNITGADIIRFQAQRVAALSDSELESMAGKSGALLGANYTDPNSTRGCIC